MSIEDHFVNERWLRRQTGRGGTGRLVLPVRRADPGGLRWYAGASADVLYCKEMTETLNNWEAERHGVSADRAVLRWQPHELNQGSTWRNGNQGTSWGIKEDV